MASQTPFISIYSPISRLRSGALFILFIVFFVQLFVDRSLDNIILSITCLGCCAVLLYGWLRPVSLYRYPLSSLIIFGFAITVYWLPLLATSMEGNSVINNLKVPSLVAFHLFLISTVLILATLFYRRTDFKHLQIPLRRFFIRTKLFETLTIPEVIVFSIVGLISTGINSSFSVGAEETLFVKIIQGYQFLSVMPSVYLLGRLTDSTKTAPSRSDWSCYIFYILLLLYVSIGRNSRSVFFVPIAVLGIGLVLSYIYKIIQLNLSLLIGVVISVLFLVPLASDLATAMVIVRSMRGEVPTEVLIQSTFAQLSNPKAIQLYREYRDLQVNQFWSESYISNPLLSRFSNLKFVDNSLRDSRYLDSSDKSAFRKQFFDRTIALLPGPLLSLFNPSTEFKVNSNRYGWGDYLFFIATRNPSLLGRKLVSHFSGTGIAAFGYWYLVILFILLVIMMVIFDSLSISAVAGTMPSFSPFAIAYFYDILTFSNEGSLYGYLAFLLRNFPQSLFIFLSTKYLIAILIPKWRILKDV